jgi:integrase/recombinase XerC
LSSYAYVLYKFADEAPDAVRYIDDVDIADWLARCGVSDSTMATYLTRLRGFFKWATFRGITASDPTAMVKHQMRIQPRQVREHNWLTEAQVAEVLETVPSSLIGLRDEIVLRLGFTCGLRASEIAAVKWRDVNLEAQSLTLQGKGGKLATLHLNDRTRDALAHWRDLYEAHQGAGCPVVVRFQARQWPTYCLTPMWGVGIGRHTVSSICVRYADASGVVFKPHDMRRTFAGLIADKVGIEATSAALRHSDLGTTQRYLEKRQDAAQRAVQAAGLNL